MFSRRNFMKLALASLATTCSDPRQQSSRNPTKSQPSNKPITEQEYAKIFDFCVENFGRDTGVSEQYSEFIPGSKNLIVILGDFHNRAYERFQTTRIQKLDENFDFDAFGLEGYVGELDLQDIDLHEDFHRMNNLREFSPGYSGELTRLGKQVTSRLDEFNNRTLFDRWEGPFTDHSLYYRFISTIGELVSQAPDTAAAHAQRQESRGTPHNVFAFRVGYIALPTFAKKVGIESPNYDSREQQNCFFDANRIIKMEEKIATVRSLRDRAAEAFSSVPEFQVLDRILGQYISTCSNHIEQYQRDLNAWIFELPPSAQEEVDRLSRMDFNQAVEHIRPSVYAPRSEDWVLNSKPYRKMLMVGGGGHIPSVYETAIHENTSIISVPIDQEALMTSIALPALDQTFDQITPSR
ncbi:hypothetical protein ACFL0V_00175 [Nanoarchaeota archaeon]